MERQTETTETTLAETLPPKKAYITPEFEVSNLCDAILAAKTSPGGQMVTPDN